MPDPVILLVEDDANDEELSRTALEENSIKHELVVARDGVEALDYLLGRGKWSGAAPPLPQLMMLDLKLPKLGGLEVLEALRANERTRFLPVVVFSSSTQESDLASSYQLGANAYVSKPVAFEAFAAAVRQLGLFWMLCNQPLSGLDA
jgi:two-component system, response regulator